MESNTAKEKGYRSVIRQVADEVCDNTKKAPICAQYEKAVVKILNQNSKHPRKARDIHSSIQRALKSLVDSQHFFLYDKAYYPCKPKYFRECYAKELKKKKYFAHGDVLRISNNTCVITLSKSPDADILSYTTDVEIDDISYNATLSVDKYSPLHKEAVDLLIKYIGKENIYSIKLLDDLVIIMLRKVAKSEGISVNDIRRLVRDVYKAQCNIKVKL